MKMFLATLSQTCQTHLNDIFAFYLQKQPALAAQLQKAMSYSVFNGGKRIRPLLIYTVGYILEAPEDNLKVAAAAIELIHAYSLIHDDLPAMDNADLRRGKLSCHKAFDEPLAILAGDALQPLAFEILGAYPAKLSAQQRIAMITTLSHMIGLHGMAGGQALDIAGVNSIETLTQMYQLKTGALLLASIKLSIYAAENDDPKILSALEKYATNLGLAFQIQDDLLDTSVISGKPQGLDDVNNKMTYLRLLGAAKTHQFLEQLYQQALQGLAPLGEKADLLYELANFLLQRKK